MSSINGFNDRYAAHRANEVAAFAHNRALLFTALVARGISSVEIEYEGSSDAGAIENCTILPEGAALTGEITLLCADWSQPEPFEKTMSVRDALDETAMQLVERDHAGWENNEGGGGTVIFDVEPREIAVEHHDYYVERNNFYHSY